MSRSATTLGFVLIVSACSSDDSPSTRSLPLSIEVEVAPGTEIHKCRFVQVPADMGGHLTSMSHEYTPGSHHLLLFRTALTELPSQGESIVDCYSGGADVMKNVRGVVYASQDARGITKLPDGVGLPLAAGSVMLMQTHYINSGASVLKAKVDIKLTLADPASVREEAGVLFFYDPFIHVPSGARSSALMRCGISKDIHLLGGLSHMHKRGVGFEAFIDPPSGETTATPFYKTDDWEHPKGLATTLDVPSGSRIRFRCDYSAIGDSREFVQGQSAEDDEMCIFTGLYYPAMTANEDLCMGKADMFGAGETACLPSQECIQKCPAGSSPRFGSTGVPDVHPCWQKCFAATCPTAGRVLLDQLGCVGKNCSEACADSASGACSGCVLEFCATEFGACSSHACK
jgi:hypothetical protein